MELLLTRKIDNLCDYTYDFTWQAQRLRPDDVIPSQKGTSFTFRKLVDELRAGGDVRIRGGAGRRAAYSMGADLKHFGGSGAPEPAGWLFIDGDVSSELGTGMVSGTVYVSGIIEQPVGNIIEVVSDEPGYRKFRSITDVICNGLGKDTLAGNVFDEKARHLVLNDGLLRGTVAARCFCDALVTIEGDAHNGTGLLMQMGTVHVAGDAGMNTGAHLDGGTVVVDGMTGEFAGAYMKKGMLVLDSAKGYVGANMKDGVILARKKVRAAPPVEELAMAQEDANGVRRHLGIGHVEAMSYHKYGIQRERLVRMRDGSVVVRRD